MNSYSMNLARYLVIMKIMKKCLVDELLLKEEYFELEKVFAKKYDISEISIFRKKLD